MMKKLLASAAVVAMTVSGSAFAQSDTGSVAMGAAVSENCEVDVVSTNPNVLFALDQTVANVELTCNLATSVDVRFTSANGGLLVNSGLDAIPYTVDFEFPAGVNGFVIQGAADNVDIAAPLLFNNAAGAFLDPLSFDLRINVDGINSNATGLFAGSYDDTITIEIGEAGTF